MQVRKNDLTMVSTVSRNTPFIVLLNKIVIKFSNFRFCQHFKNFMVINFEACIGVLGIQDICHFTSRDKGYYPFYFKGYGILGSIFSLLPGILKI